jgi:hypothetical protein
VDPATGKATEEIITYDPADLTTHAVVTGMTGSGKTGLCVGLLEEAALQNIPAIVIDPKGDLTNLILHFPDLLPKDFEPWVDADAARKLGITTPQLAEQTAASWKKGLDGWGITRERIAALNQHVDFAIYTPGSDAGIPVSIIASLKAPEIPWEGNREVLMERISSTVSALLGLIGLTNIDPIRSREHILLSNIFQTAWSQGKDLDLSELILQTQSPPFEKLGVFPLDKFYPEAERTDLAMTLNNFLASPSFQTWLGGDPLDIGKMLYTSAGKPRHAIFYVAHLSDTERMFFITLLYSSIESWMRTQTGTTGLRALVYFDEIMGYLPPTANPPSKMTILRMLKQARAFGVGLLLATQNPVDVDYKALSNAGTWFIGKLQTDQDKQRLLDGLESVTGGVDRSQFDRIISGLGKRVFLLHNVHSSGPVQMATRWAMNYLAGPLTRVQIPMLNQLAGAKPMAVSAGSLTGRIAPSTSADIPMGTVSGPSTAASVMGSTGLSQTKPSVPRGITEVFLPNNQTFSESAGSAANAQSAKLIYKPVLLGQTQTRYLDRRYGVDQLIRRLVVVEDPDPRGLIHWEDYARGEIDPRQLGSQPVNGAAFSPLESPLSDVRMVTSLQKDFQDWVYQTGEMRVKANLSLKAFAGPGTSTGEFKQQCSEAARRGRDAEIEKISIAAKKKMEMIRQKLEREEAELAADKADLGTRTMEEVGSGLETVLGLFGGRKRSVSKNLTKRRMTANAKADVDESVKAIALYKSQLADMEKEVAAQVEQINERWVRVMEDVTELPILPTKTNIYLEVFGVAWAPYYAVDEKLFPAWKP